MIIPTPGRIVWYRPGPDEPRPRQSDQPLAAIVTAVLSDREVNLAVFDHDGVPYGRTNVQLLQDGDAAPEHGYAEWMPFQKGQAQKTAELEALAAAPAVIIAAADVAVDGALTASGIQAAPQTEPQPVVELQPQRAAQ